MPRGMIEMDVTLDDGGRLARGTLAERAGREPIVVPDGGRAAGPEPEPGPSPLRGAGRALAGTPARRGRLAVSVVALAVVVAGPLLARASVSDARVAVRAQAAERAAAAEARAGVEADERATGGEQVAAAARAAEARALRNEQRRRLAALGLNEATIDAYLVEIDANADWVEFDRDRTSGRVDRQAAEIPQMQECVRVASRALNAAWNSATFGAGPPPAPSELCRALLDAGS